MNGSKPYVPPGNRRTPRRRHERGARGGFFPLTLTLSRGERDSEHRQGKADSCGFFTGQSRIHPLPRERAGGEGKRREVPPAYWNNPEIVELGESSGRAGGFPK